MMSSWFVHLSLLAEQPQWRALGGNLLAQQSRLDVAKTLSVLLFLATLVISIWILSKLLAQSDQPRVYNNARALFRNLCQLHGLSPTERSLMRQLASYGRLAQPAELFLRPECFLSERLPPELQAKHPQIESIRRRVFGDEAL
jgi:hypothetical protein